MTQKKEIDMTEVVSAGPAGETRREKIKRLAKENVCLRQWVNDIQSGMYVNCVYCGHRYGPDPGTPVAMAEILKQHIEQCPEHPMSALKKQLESLTLAGPCGILGHRQYWDGPLFHEPHCKCFGEPEPVDGKSYLKCNCDFENATCTKCQEQQVFNTTVKSLHIPQPGEKWEGVYFASTEGELNVHVPHSTGQGSRTATA